MDLMVAVVNVLLIPLVGVIAWFIRQWVDGIRLSLREIKEEIVSVTDDHETRLRRLESGEMHRAFEGQFKELADRINRFEREVGERLARIETKTGSGDTMRPKRRG
jgi:Na+/phosphate symporter